MSQDSVRRDIAAKRAYAENLEQRTKDPAHAFADPAHREHLLAEARRVRAEADREEAKLAMRQGK
jgi:hypothetical protein